MRSRVASPAAALIAAAAIATSVFALNRTPPSPPEAAWEYKILNLSNTGFQPKDVNQTESTLNQLGREGWELVQVKFEEGMTLNGTYYLKRRK